MNIRTRLLALGALAILFSCVLVACSENDGSPAQVTAGSSSLTSYVPEDTPYLAGNLEPVPTEVVDAMFERFQPMLESAQHVMAEVNIQLSSSQENDDPARGILLAVLREMDGKLNRSGLESLGLSLEAHQVIYGLGVYPVARVELGDAQALRDAIARIESRSGMSIPVHVHEGHAYWKLGPPANQGDSTHLSAYFAIIETEEPAHFVFAILPSDMESQFLPRFLGQVKPERDTASARLAKLNREFGYTNYGTGVVEFKRLFDQLTDKESEFNRSLGADGTVIQDRLNEVCQAEIREIINRVPRAIGGTTELTTSAVGVQYRVSLAEDLAKELADLVPDVPAAPANSTRLAEFAFGLRLGAARDFLIRKATAFSEAQYQCEALKGINALASQALTALNKPMPPLVNNFLGIRASIDGMAAGEVDPSAVSGMMALHVDKPEMFVGMAQMLLPGLEEFRLAPGDPPKPLPESLLPMPGIVAHAAMSDNALGISVGDGEEVGLQDYLNAKSQKDDSFLSFNYDLAAYLERLDELTGSYFDEGSGQDTGAMLDGTDNPDSHSDGEPEASERSREIARAMQKSFRAMAGRSRIELRFDEDGFALDSRMTFQQ